MVSTPLVAAVGGGSLSRGSLSVGGMTVLEKLLPGVAVYSVQAELARRMDSGVSILVPAGRRRGSLNQVACPVKAGRGSPWAMDYNPFFQSGKRDA